MATLRPLDPPHKGIRNALSQLSLAAGSTAASDTAAVEALVTLCIDVLDFLDEHADFEEKYILEESKNPVALPSNLNEAIIEMERSQLVRETLGEHVFEYVLRNKRAEWLDYSRQVSAFELDRYLPVL